jgi:hypothetical protein
MCTSRRPQLSPEDRLRSGMPLPGFAERRCFRMYGLFRGEIDLAATGPEIQNRCLKPRSDLFSLSIRAICIDACRRTYKPGKTTKSSIDVLNGSRVAGLYSGIVMVYNLDVAQPRVTGNQRPGGTGLRSL